MNHITVVISSIFWLLPAVVQDCSDHKFGNTEERNDGEYHKVVRQDIGSGGHG